MILKCCDLFYYEVFKVDVKMFDYDNKVERIEKEIKNILKGLKNG